MKLKLILLVIFLASIVFTVYFLFFKDSMTETFTDKITQSEYPENSTLSIESMEHREALLISNNEYKYMSKLQDISSNLTTLEKTLNSLKFTVKIKNNLDDKQLKQAINQFRNRLAKNTKSIGFLYYAGHGCQLDNVGYLVPTNVDTKKKIDIEYDAMNIDKMLKTLDSAGNKTNMIFLDACRDIPTGVRGGSTRGLAQAPKTPQGTLLVYATEAGETADDNTRFINSLINNIKQPNQHIRSIAFKISDEIATKTEGNQIPEIFAKWLPKTILNQTTSIPKEEIEELETAPKIKKEEIAEILPPKVIEKKYSLTVKTDPIDATIKILNIKLTYRDGILLKEGNYKIEVSKEGYENQVFKLDIQENFTKEIVLIKNPKKEYIDRVVVKKNPLYEKHSKNASYLGGKQKDVKNSYYIKVGTYRDASTVVSKIKRINFNYSLVGVENDRSLIRVLIGPFFSRNQANAQLAKIKANVLTGAYVTKAQ